MFDPKDHLMKLKGKDYLQVAWRLCWMRDLHPDWILETELLQLDREKGFALFKAEITEPHTEHIIATGHGSETVKDFGDYIEKAETKAVGRALAMAGLGTQFCYADFDEGDRIVDSPVTPSKRSDAKKGTQTSAGTKNAAETQQEPHKGAAETQQKPDRGVPCEMCGLEISGVPGKSGAWLEAEKIIQIGEKRYGKKLCAVCQKTLAALEATKQ